MMTLAMINDMDYSRAVKGEETQEEKDTETALKNSLELEYEQQMTARSTEEEQVKQAIQNSEDDMIVQTIINPTSRTEKENLATSSSTQLNPTIS